MHVSGLDKNYIKTLLDILFKEKQFSILGHFNINLLNYNNHQPNNEFLDSINSNLFMAYILQSTRIASHSKSFTDNVPSIIVIILDNFHHGFHFIRFLFYKSLT